MGRVSNQMLKNLQRIENCVYNAFEKIKELHKFDAYIAVYVLNEDNGVQVCWFIVGVHMFRGSFLIKNARIYQDVYAYAYKLLSDITRPYFKK